MSEVLLKAGEVLYVPTQWFHYISNIGINAQCNRWVPGFCDLVAFEVGLFIGVTKCLGDGLTDGLVVVLID